MFRQIPIEISVGCSVILLTPVYVPSKGLPMVEFIHSVVGKVKIVASDKWIYAEDHKNKGGYIKVPEWRIVRYTYGGIWLDNRKFDQRRIDNQNLNIIAKKNPNKNATSATKKLGAGRPPKKP
jgi:hypothetical protein